MRTTYLLAGNLPGALLYGWALAPIVSFCNDYLFNDWQFFITLCVVIGVDTLLGLWHHWQLHNLSSKGFAQVIRKVAFYFLFLIATHALARHKVNGQLNTLLTWVDSLTYSTILVREFLSILEHSAALKLFVPPAWLLSRLAQFDAQGKLSNPTEPEANPTNPHA